MNNIQINILSPKNDTCDDSFDSEASKRQDKGIHHKGHLIELSFLSQGCTRSDGVMQCFIWAMSPGAALANLFTHSPQTDITKWRLDGSEQSRSGDRWREWKVRTSDELIRSGDIRAGIDHPAVWIRVIKLVSLLNTPICLHNAADVYKKTE